MLDAEPRDVSTVNLSEESKENESETPTVIVLQTQDSSSADANGTQTDAVTDLRHQVALLYPFDGSEALGRVSVTFGDIKRLAPGEFLNDNLIDFYLR
jgi:Ulp1 family protease